MDSVKLKLSHGELREVIHAIDSRVDQLSNRLESFLNRDDTDEKDNKRVKEVIERLRNAVTLSNDFLMDYKSRVEYIDSNDV
ncbi:MULTISPECIES: hypothetical protein [Bacillaceae]|uniref:Uncharacterized protein n=1 Tax=Evansella alkalicola TaxID=745819 RepID=A0ABS6JZT9_9BACI|nr:MULTISPECIES: hypothetical protein [Bacillaceae]MBU9724103.1 hypothetical protein [Bacillus alkalicola]